METVRILQLGTEDFSKTMEISACAEWHYEPDFSCLPKRNFDVAVLDREITEDEFDYLVQFLRAYCLFVTETAVVHKDGALQRLVDRKVGRKVSTEELKCLLRDDLQDYFSGSYGEKYHPDELAIAWGVQGSVSWRGYEGVDLNGEYGSEFEQVVYWRYNKPLLEKQTMEFWLEYAKDASVEISLEITLLQFEYTSNPKLQNVRIFTEEELEHIVYVENTENTRVFIFASLKAKGQGRLTVTALHDRHSRRGKGLFLPGGERMVTSDREEVFYYFDPGNLKPPLNVYFSGYKTKEGFEAYHMMRRMGHPFLLIAEARLEGGAFYIGSEEYEDLIEQIIRKHMEKLGFQNSQVILSGLSMGTFGALYYGCRICPHTILLGKPIASIGTVAENTRIKSPEGSNFWVDVLHKACGSQNKDAVNQINNKFWDAFDHTDWSHTRFAVAYMIEDDLDGDAYEKLLSHIKDAGARIYGKGLHGRHNDDTPGIVGWFVNQYYEIMRNNFDRTEKKQAGGDHDR